MRRTRRRERSLSGALTVIAVCVLVPLAVLITLTFLWGWRLEYVRTGSMEPTYPVGSLLIAQPIEPSEVEVGMPLTYVDPLGDYLSTHRVQRVVRAESGELSFVTKGDANPRRDARPVPPENVRARVRWHVPGLGQVLWSLRGPWGYALFLGLPALVIVGGELKDRYRRRRHPTVREGAVAPPDSACTTCNAAIAAADRYCRDCGNRQLHVPPHAQSRDGSAEAVRGVDLVGADP